ncbi:hypothetical protein CN384_25775 [Bacillus thuringiensis]|uniref:hypothetical protein n=1 Tax=Bacillus thuringiensis TaxID=1428 RepID=UPI000BF7A049|nr:hypothetical protein [Bacillus thuringiensis]PFA22337.1 hypothetical protein CN384_25775 [Bacillus thuringiensis]PGN16899.1 hypothetical protein CN951_25275 [Bacillus thuringiensis]PGQ63381.1 hypothetical protein COA16_02280 [Bacillus thuringiensis]
MKKFEFKKTYEEVEIAEKVFRIDLNDDKVFEYQESFNKYGKEMQEDSSSDIESFGKEEQKEFFDKQLQRIKEVIEIMLGKDSFEHIYEASGRSIINLAELVTYLSNLIGEKTVNIRDEKKKKYVKPGRK